MMKRWHITICGKVQGVFYRKSTQEKAFELGLTGWVRNLPDGCVECEAQGEEYILNRLVSWMKVGPPACQVTQVAFVEIEPEDDPDPFNIRY